MVMNDFHTFAKNYLHSHFFKYVLVAAAYILKNKDRLLFSFFVADGPTERYSGPSSLILYVVTRGVTIY